MLTSTAQHLQHLSPWARRFVWLAALMSPTGYLVLMLLVAKYQLIAPPGWLVVALFCLMPVLALVVCGMVVWTSKSKRGWRVGWLVLTFLALLIECGALAVIIISAITVAISPA